MGLPVRVLGRTGLKVTQLGYGAMEVRGERIWAGRPCTDKQARDILNAVLDAGINFIDTANDYGKSELFIGRHIAHRRNEYSLATKCGCHVVFAGDHDDTPHFWNRENILRNIADSLMKMETDFVEVLQLHNPTVEQAEEFQLVEVLRELRDSGVVKFIGCSSTNPHLAHYIQWGVFDTFQIPYSALDRRHENLISLAADAGAGIIIRGGVARGEPAMTAGRSNQALWTLFENARLDDLRESGETRTSFLLRFTLSHPECHTTIVGTLDPKHLQQNVDAAMRGPLKPDVYEEAKRRLDAAGECPERI